MKKLILLAGCLSFGLSEATDTTNANKEALEGFFIGIGVNYTHTENKIDGHGQYDPNSELAVPGNYVISHTKTDKIGGTIVAGYGVFVANNYYIGAEFALDMNKHRKISSKYDMPESNGNTYNSKIKGIIPSFSLRIGKYAQCCDSLIYAKLGVAKISSEFQDTARRDGMYYADNVRRLSKFTPLIGLGIEKQIGEISLRVEGEYKLPINKSDRNVVKSDDVDYNGIYSPVKNRLSVASIRVIASYNF